MDVRGIHLALQFQIQAEMDGMFALVIAAFIVGGIPSRLFHSFLSQLVVADRGLCLYPIFSVQGLTV